jgi:hypothetical protein
MQTYTNLFGPLLQYLEKINKELKLHLYDIQHRV